MLLLSIFCHSRDQTVLLMCRNERNHSKCIWRHICTHRAKSEFRSFPGPCLVSGDIQWGNSRFTVSKHTESIQTRTEGEWGCWCLREEPDVSNSAECPRHQSPTIGPSFLHYSMCCWLGSFNFIFHDSLLRKTCCLFPLSSVGKLKYVFVKSRTTFTNSLKPYGSQHTYTES